MIVTCPNCQTRYNLPDAKIPADGAKVKCSKCAHVFKAELPPVTPEEKVESLLEDESPATETQAGDDFEETFEDVASGEDKAAAPESPVEESAEEGPEEDMPGMDDLFDESDDIPTPDEGASPTGGGVDDLFGDSEDESEEEADDTSDLFEDGDDDTGDLFADEDDEGDEDEDDDEDEDEEYEEDDGFSLEDKSSKGGSKKSLGCLIFLLIIAFGIGGAIYFKVWTYAGIDNPGDLLRNVPFVGQMFSEDIGDGEEVAPGESPADRVRKIELKNVKQYYVANEKVGNLFVVEGKAVNKFAMPKEQIKVEVVLYDTAGTILVSQTFLCGNVLSQFQLQVQTQNEIEDGLSSEVGILSNNTFIRPGASSPFMAVFFTPPAGVKEFLVKVIDVNDTE